MNTPERDAARWKDLDGILDAVLELPSDQRSAFLDEACSGDDALRKHVERLLAHEDQIGSFIETPAFAASSEETGLVSLLKGSHEPQPLLHAGRVIAGRFQILSKLGKGGMGEVWRAFDLKLRIDVALKTLRLDFRHRAEDLIDLIRREVRTAREVISPNVCRIFDLVNEEDRELILMEYIDGITLQEMMEQRAPLDLLETRDIAAQFLAGLEAIHGSGLVHRDLKPENIMITRTGRVVVMDLGIAEPIMQTSRAISGTLPYMSPEQIAGAKIDARSDIFSAGVVLAEMIHTRGAQSKTTREVIWKSVREDPMQLPDSPWKEVIARAVAPNRDRRFESATALSRALEEIPLRTEAGERQTPYPGLASFQGKDSDYFFGREQEVETLIKKVQQQQLLALIGPSGAGKTSLLQAGLLPALPKDWRSVIVHPGDAPFVHLRQTLTSHLSVTEADNAELLRLEEPEVAISILNRLRQGHIEFVLIVDRFEELFTLNPPSVQSRFAELLGRAAMETKIRILLAMRDDFLILCKGYEALAPIFSELTAMLPLTGSALRRALVQPALKCGYRFEDETLVDDMLRDLEKERGALPSLAFAASLLWEKRDRRKGQLTREAYKSIGGVPGALAQHAENTMMKLGPGNESIVREIFRNLISSRQTRIAREIKELLSVFPEQDPAELVLHTLIDARLLTSFESVDQGENSRSRVEISHESLITNWPRLVKWQTQDSESALLRDQLRQAAGLWVERDRSQDLLWTGDAFLEYQVWRHRYPGGLTSTEEAFAQAMSLNANRKRRRRQITVAAIFVVLLAALGVIANFWQKALIAREEAVLQAKHAEAGVALNAGRALPESDSTTKLAYALASLERADTAQGRRFALQALSEGPVARMMEIGRNVSVELSPNGRWLAVGRSDGSIDLLDQDGSAKRTVQPPFLPGNYVPWTSQFSPESNLLLWTWREDPRVVKVWSISENKLVRMFQLEGNTMCLVRGNRAFLITDLASRTASFGWSDSIIRVWGFDQNEPEIIGRFSLKSTYWRCLDIDLAGHWIGYATGDQVYVRSLNGHAIGPEQRIGNHRIDTGFVRFHPNGNQIASSNNSEIRIWSLIPGRKNPVRTIPGTGRRISFDPDGNYLFGLQGDGLARWDLIDEKMQPLLFRSIDGSGSVIFDKQKRWIAISGGASLAFYPARRSHPYVYFDSNPRFTTDGQSLITASSEGIRIWSLPGKSYASRLLWNSKWNTDSFNVDSSGKHILSVTGNGVHLISVTEGKDLFLESLFPTDTYEEAVISVDSKSAAAIGPRGIQVWNLQTNRTRVLEQSKTVPFGRLAYSTDGSLISGDLSGKLYRWNLNDDSVRILDAGNGDRITAIAISKDNRLLVSVTSSSKNIFDLPESTSELVLHDLKSGTSSRIRSHGNRVHSVNFDPAGTMLITSASSCTVGT